MPISRTLAVRKRRRHRQKDVTDRRPEEFVKWAGQQTSHRLSRSDKRAILRRRVSGWLYWVWESKDILSSIGVRQATVTMLKDVKSRLQFNDRYDDDDFGDVCCCNDCLDRYAVVDDCIAPVYNDFDENNVFDEAFGRYLMDC